MTTTLSLNNSHAAVVAAGKIIAAGGSFANHAKSLSGHAGGADSLGKLPGCYWDSALSADYVISSYATPIAWLVDGDWVVPPVKYSVTTSKHLSKALSAIHYSV
jgi:hypothetical protein